MVEAHPRILTVRSCSSRLILSFGRNWWFYVKRSAVDKSYYWWRCAPYIYHPEKYVSDAPASTEIRPFTLEQAR